jgi:membrane protease YdiL (CAAX protease family)
MSDTSSDKPGFWETVRLLLGVARKRGLERKERQRQMLHRRTGRRSLKRNAGCLFFVVTLVFAAIVNVLAAFVVGMAVDEGEHLQIQRWRKMAVSPDFFQEAIRAEKQAAEAEPPLDRSKAPLDYASEARRIHDTYGGDAGAIETRLRTLFQQHGTRDFITRSWTAAFTLAGFTTFGPLPAMLGSWALIAWFVMLVCQGEGLDLDVQRRRDPIWEWLFSHPAPPGAIFLAEMLSPIPGSPFYWGAPLFAGVLYGLVYGFARGSLAVVLVGIPATIAAACLGKALEMAIMLRFSPRSRGAMIGLMGWIGYTSTMLTVVWIFALRTMITAVSTFLPYLTVIGWPWLRLFVGGRVDGSFSFVSGVAASWAASAIIVASAVWFTVWSSGQGLSGNFGARPVSAKSHRIEFGRDPLYRKEFLWFIRDRSAIVQAILIPLTIAGVQLFNLRGLLHYAQSGWNYLAGAAILFGTYFLWVLGPKSLLSEGNALWIPLTWPRGLESLLKSKAWLWNIVASAVVLLILAYAAFLFPSQIWKIALVAVGWYFFGHSMSEKSVTLVSAPSSSGQPERVPLGRRGAAQLGMLTFTIGVVTQQWQVAIMGIVYSYMTAAAMWQNLRARLPYLFDPWSETLPPPPTLMHAMIAISILVDGAAVATVVLIVFFGRDNIALARATAYAASAITVCAAVAYFLERRGVSLRDVWTWPASRVGESQSWRAADENSSGKLMLLLLAGAVGGVILGLFAHGYSAVLARLPVTSELIRKSQEQMTNVPHLKVSYAVMAVIFAPFAEEYLFRGLLFRALDLEWGGWRALLGGATFFAIYHPPLAWLPVALVGLTNEVLFKKGGRLAPAVVLHMVYNAVVLM